ncbi:TonB-dependent receptor [Sphingobium boeckii]|uniref:Iron complex outermembrane receptor protein n=1 Tax=Sphingobium boeckii TaxID=1082345 RepID=A0A7W9AJ04_9SPHN|nr:TonB-dependent receptor [Sphingobium boeckii]MBB5686557.1 iron complex outermembrane receptor protein [Sphingobium boeckii]
MFGIRAMLIATASLMPVDLLAQEPAPGAALGEIVVTAQKREQALKDVPISMSVVGAEELARTRAADLRDISRLIPNFALLRGGAIDTVLIRGVGGGGRNIGFTTRAGVYVDGVYAGQFAAVNQDTLDVERVEVLRGPQGQLFGRNTVSGAVSIVTKQPGPDLGGWIEAGYGSKQLYEIKGGINLPLAAGVALRISGSHRERNGFTLNVPTGDDLDNIDRDTARAQLRAALGGRTVLTLTADYSRDDTRKMVGEPITDTFGTGPTPLPGAFDTPFNRVPDQDVEVVGGSATLVTDLSDALTLTAISGVRHIDWRRTSDLDFIPLDLFASRFHDVFDQFSQEIRIALDDDSPVKAVAGVYYFDENSKTLRTASGGTQVALVGLGLPVGPAAQVSARIKRRSAALFGHADWAITHALTLNAGLRYTHEWLRLRDYDTFGPAIFGLANFSDFNDSRGESSLDPSIGLTYALSDQANVYAKYTRGFKSGGWNVDFVNAMQFARGIDFKTESVDAFEIGLKGETQDRRIRYSLAGFYAVYEHYQINQFVDLGQGQTAISLRNAAQLSTWGGEASLAVAPASGLTIGADIGYAQAGFDSFPEGAPGVDFAGKRAPYAPRLTTSANAAYEMPVDAIGGALTVSANWSYRSGAFSGPENRPDEKLDARHLVDGRIELFGGGERWSLALWARNLFNESWIDNRIIDFFQTRAVERGEPRTYGISGRIGF